MRFPPWAIPAVVLAYVGVRVTLLFRRGRRQPGQPGKTWFQTVPVWIRILWVLLALAMVTLALWKPRAAPPPPNPPRANGASTP